MVGTSARSFDRPGPAPLASADGFPAPFLGGNVGKRFRERPLMARRVLCAVLAFAVLEVGRLHKDACAVPPSPFTVAAHVLYADRHRVCDLAGTGRTAIPPYVADDQGPVAELELSAVVLSDPHPLHEPEGRTEPADRLTHVGVDQDGDDSCRRDRAIGLHAAHSTPMCADPTRRLEHIDDPPRIGV